MLGRVLVVVLGVDAALAWVVLQARMLFVQVVWFALRGHVFAGAEPSAVARHLAFLVVVQRLAWLSTALLFLVWCYRAHRRLRARGAAMVADPVAALRAFLVPGANVVRAPRVVATLWRASDPGLPPRTATRWVAWWWGICLAVVAVDLGTALAHGGLRGLEGGLGLLTLGEGLRIGAAVLTIVVVSRIDRAQRRLLGAPPAAAEPE